MSLPHGQRQAGYMISAFRNSVVGWHTRSSVCFSGPIHSRVSASLLAGAPACAGRHGQKRSTSKSWCTSPCTRFNRLSLATLHRRSLVMAQGVYVCRDL